MSKLKWITGTALGLSLLVSANASATTLNKLSSQEMIESASSCVIADVVASTQEKRNGQVVTLTTFNVSKTAFGSTDQTITVETLGGRSNVGRLKTASVFAGSPRFFMGQEALMLINQNADSGNYSLVGFNQGNFRVTEAVQGRRTVRLPEDLGGTVSVEQALVTLATERVAPARAPIGN